MKQEQLFEEIYQGTLREAPRLIPSTSMKALPKNLKALAEDFVQAIVEVINDNTDEESDEFIPPNLYTKEQLDAALSAAVEQVKYRNFYC